MTNMEYIEDYFKSSPTEAEKLQFEQRIINDISFAEEVAFYISANGLILEQLQEDKKQRFRQIYEAHKVAPIAKTPVMKPVRYLAAASVVAAVILMTWLFTGKNTSQQLADQYIQQNWQTLSGTMSASQDSLQNGLNLYNLHKFPEALVIFEALAKTEPTNYTARKYAGISSLRLANYDKALLYFNRLETDTTLKTNPGKLYKAITLLERNKNGDKEAAKQLLREVRDQKDEELEGKDEAAQWLKKLE